VFKVLAQDLPRVGVGPSQGWLKVCLALGKDSFKSRLRSKVAQGLFRIRPTFFWE
jgi:hypothetical protein